MLSVRSVCKMQNHLTKDFEWIFFISKFGVLIKLKTLAMVYIEITDEWLDFVVNCRRGIKHDIGINFI